MGPNIVSFFIYVFFISKNYVTTCFFAKHVYFSLAARALRGALLHLELVERHRVAAPALERADVLLENVGGLAVKALGARAILALENVGDPAANGGGVVERAGIGVEVERLAHHGVAQRVGDAAYVAVEDVVGAVPAGRALLVEVVEFVEVVDDGDGAVEVGGVAKSVVVFEPEVSELDDVIVEVVVVKSERLGQSLVGDLERRVEVHNCIHHVEHVGGSDVALETQERVGDVVHKRTQVFVVVDVGVRGVAGQGGGDGGAVGVALGGKIVLDVLQVLSKRHVAVGGRRRRVVAQRRRVGAQVQEENLRVAVGVVVCGHAAVAASDPRCRGGRGDSYTPNPLRRCGDSQRIRVHGQRIRCMARHCARKKLGRQKWV